MTLCIVSKKKYEENIAAIKLLKQLEYEDREATDEEKNILAKYAILPEFNIYKHETVILKIRKLTSKINKGKISVTNKNIL